jgi:hypothetical protein
MEKNVMQATKNTLTAIKNNRKEYDDQFAQLTRYVLL